MKSYINFYLKTFLLITMIYLFFSLILALILSFIPISSLLYLFITRCISCIVMICFSVYLFKNQQRYLWIHNGIFLCLYTLLACFLSFPSIELSGILLRIFSFLLTTFLLVILTKTSK